ncbi:MAG TPA: class I SAM-dependent methyltransferase [Gammaproteobacteria bacterium]|nr:class I SAM-dependent methyltransferase [Gammaproteobacteria bacterium]
MLDHPHRFPMPPRAAPGRAFRERVAADLEAAFSGTMVRLGQRLGLYRALADAGPLTPAQLAERTGTRERYVREWLRGQAAGGYLAGDQAAGTYWLPAAHAETLAPATEGSSLAAALELAATLWQDEDQLVETFRTGQGLGWHQHHPRLFDGTAGFFDPDGRVPLVESWIRALRGVEDKLRRGGRVADVGCGYGMATVLLAQAYPPSRFYGFDCRPASIRTARRNAEMAGVQLRVSFEEGEADQLPNREFDLICFMDGLGDFEHPLGAARRAREALAANGTVLLVEPVAALAAEDPSDPEPPLFGAARAGWPLTHPLSGPGWDRAGGQTPAALLAEAGFRRLRCAAETPSNRILEARP